MYLRSKYVLEALNFFIAAANVVRIGNRFIFISHETRSAVLNCRKMRMRVGKQFPSD
jgi:hypothetical protein